MASCGSSARARNISPMAAGLGVSARWLDSHIALGARFAMQQAVLPVRDGLIGGNDLVRSGYRQPPLLVGQTPKNTGGRPRHIRRGFPVRLTADSTRRTIPELKRAAEVFYHPAAPTTHRPARGETVGKWPLILPYSGARYPDLADNVLSGAAPTNISYRGDSLSTCNYIRSVYVTMNVSYNLYRYTGPNCRAMFHILA